MRRAVVQPVVVAQSIALSISQDPVPDDAQGIVRPKRVAAAVP